MKKVIVLDFPDDFIPPENYTEPVRANDYKSPCQKCPFFQWDDDFGGMCNFPSDNEDYCPIKEYF